MSEQLDLAIRNGTVVTPADRAVLDVGIRAGRIVEVGRSLGPARAEIDASNRYVLPGAIDSHCHVAQESSTGLMTADDFHTATLAAACGGTTTIIPFAAQHRGQSLRAVVDEYHRRASDKAVVDYAFHMIISDPGERTIRGDLPSLIDEGCTSFKIFMTYDALKLSDAQILDVMSAAHDHRALVMVHAENSDAIAWMTRRLVASGRTAPRYHADSRPAATEREAVHRVITLAELADVALLIVHVSSADALEQIRWARRRGLPVYAETCPQYLFFTAQDLDRPGFEGAKYIFSPPARDRVSQEALWQGLHDRTLDVLSSDHAPYRFADADGKAVHGTDAPFPKIPNGMPGLETCLPVVFSEGVLQGRLTLEQFVALSATNAARIYGLYPRKGIIAPGADADLAIWDADLKVTIRNEQLHHRMDYTPYEGMTVTGWPVTTISRGEVVWDKGVVSARPGRGMFLPCERFDRQRAAAEGAAQPAF
jgi:dihydropyrimidinase